MITLFPSTFPSHHKFFYQTPTSIGLMSSVLIYTVLTSILLAESDFTWITPNGRALWSFSLISYGCPIARCSKKNILASSPVATNQCLEKHTERTICAVKQVRKFLKNQMNSGIKLLWSRLILNWGTMEHGDSFHRNKRRRYNIFSHAKFLWTQTRHRIVIMASLGIWCSCLVIRKPFSQKGLVTSLYKTA